MARLLRIGTRGSPLALAQARLVAEALRDTLGWGPERIEIVPITTSGDMIQDRPLAEVGGKALWRSEEHTSELQSLMRISYAVFCLKKKKTKMEHKHTMQGNNREEM